MRLTHSNEEMLKGRLVGADISTSSHATLTLQRHCLHALRTPHEHMRVQQEALLSTTAGVAAQPLPCPGTMLESSQDLVALAVQPSRHFTQLAHTVACCCWLCSHWQHGQLCRQRVSGSVVYKQR